MNTVETRYAPNIATEILEMQESVDAIAQMVVAPPRITRDAWLNACRAAMFEAARALMAENRQVFIGRLAEAATLLEHKVDEPNVAAYANTIGIAGRVVARLIQCVEWWPDEEREAIK